MNQIIEKITITGENIFPNRDNDIAQFLVH